MCYSEVVFSNMSSNMQPTASSKQNPKDFEIDAVAALGKLQIALREVIAAIPGPSLRRPADLQKTLGVHRKLAWQIHKFAHAPGPMAEATILPSARAIRQVVNAVRKHGGPEHMIRTADDAIDQIEDVIKQYAGTRAHFDSMLAGLASKESEQIDYAHRRAAFHANSHIWGSQARTQLACYCLQASDTDPSRIDFFSLGGLVDLRRFRTNVPWTVMNSRVMDETGVISESNNCHVIDDEGGSEQNPAGLLRQFCTSPLPQCRRFITRRGRLMVELQADGMGNQTVITCMRSHIWRSAVPRYITDVDPMAHYSSRVRTPVESLVFDLLVHDNVYPNISLESLLYTDHRGADNDGRDLEMDLMSKLDPPTLLGRGAATLYTPEVPRYPEMAQFVFDRLGWDSSRFLIHRFRMDYPVMPASVMLQFDLPTASL
jgi:hypothetical protein